jgi:tetratricopeptide (TPR) repeat protein
VRSWLRRVGRWLERILQGWALPPRLPVALGFPYRWGRLGLAIGQGWIARLKRHAWWPFMTTLAIAFAILIGGPLLLSVAVDLLELLGVTNVPAAPTVGEWVSFVNVVLLTLAVLFARWLLRARNRVIVEGFVDFTKDEATAVSGLSTLLVTELGRLRGLYHQIDDLSVPTAVGVERHGGFGRAKEAGDFLTVSADDRTDVLQSVVSSDTSVQLGPAKIPIGPLLNFLGRLARGPRVIGSVHLTEAGGGPTLTAQLVDKEVGGTWRVDQEREPESEAERRAFLDSMVRELACQVFTQVALKGSVRWQAVEPFNEYLRLYRDSRRTPRDRASFLKQAQERLLEAVTEDESFDLAYYNLGVIYTQLAHTERLAEEQADDATSRASFRRSELEAARLEAARVAFLRAIKENPDRWEAYYALAVTIFSEVPEVEIDEALDPADPDGAKLRKVIELCEQVLAVSAGQGANLATVYDLRGMAQTRLAGEHLPRRLGRGKATARQRRGVRSHRQAMASHRRAMHHAWIEYCRARQYDIARPTGQPGLTEHARANATAALHNLALDYERRAAIARRMRKAKQADPEGGRESRRSLRERLDRRTSQGLFKWAGRRAGEGSVVSASCRFERGGALEHAGKHRKAASQFRQAARIQPLSAEYRARRAKALAKQARSVNRRGWMLRALMRPLPHRLRGNVPDLEKEAQQSANRAIDLLAGPFSAAMIPFTPAAPGLQCKATLSALKKTYRVLAKQRAKRDSGDITFAIKRQQIEAIRHLLRKVEAASTERDPETKLEVKRKDPREGAEELRAGLAGFYGIPDAGLRAWERDQLELAIGKLYAEARAWEEALERFTALARRISSREETNRLVDFGAYAHLAQALRESARGKGRAEETDLYMRALRTAAEGVRRDPLSVGARREAGRAHFALGQYSDALAARRHALWLSPSDPYLHYEIAMCYRRLAQDEPEPGAANRLTGGAKEHFDRARHLFDGEDLDGEAWARFWRGKLALEGGEPAEAVEYLQGAEHGSAEAAAALLLGEAHLALDQRPAADHAFDRCAEAMRRLKADPKLGEKSAIDWLWGDELPWKAVEARIMRGKAEALYLAPGDWQSPQHMKEAEKLLREAHRALGELETAGSADAREAHDAAMTRLLDTDSMLLRMRGKIDAALNLVRERLRYQKTPEALYAEAELLHLRAHCGRRLSRAVQAELAAERTWQALPGNGRPPVVRPTLQRRLRRAVGTVVAVEEESSES